MSESGIENFLLIPLFLEKRLAGALFIAKADVDSGYTPEEIELVKAVATQTVLVIECLRCLYEQAETRARALAHALPMTSSTWPMLSAMRQLISR